MSGTVSASIEGVSRWSSLGGATISAPAAVSANAKRIDVWVRGANNVLQHKVWIPSGWSAWSETWFTGPRL